MTVQFRQVLARFAARASIAMMLVPAAGAAVLDGPMIVVKLDQAKVVQLPAKAQTLIVGNPIIADVTLLRGGVTMVITGKGFGQTNLIVLDSSGTEVTESTIRVEAATGSLLIVQRGTDRESYSCTPRCEPTVQLGDSKAFSNDAAGEIQARNGLASPGGTR